MSFSVPLILLCTFFLPLSQQLQGPSSEEFAAASKLEDNINFFQTDDPNIAKIFHIEPSAKRPSLVLLKKEAEKVTHYG